MAIRRKRHIVEPTRASNPKDEGAIKLGEEELSASGRSFLDLQKQIGNQSVLRLLGSKGPSLERHNARKAQRQPEGAEAGTKPEGNVFSSCCKSALVDMADIVQGAKRFPKAAHRLRFMSYLPLRYARALPPVWQRLKGIGVFHAGELYDVAEEEYEAHIVGASKREGGPTPLSEFWTSMKEQMEMLQEWESMMER